MSISIRKAVPADASQIAHFQVCMAAETEQKELDGSIVRRAVERVFRDDDKGFYLVATTDEQVVSSLMITYEWSDWRDTNLWYIQSVFILPEFRGQGIFRKMYDAVLSLARSDDVKMVRLYVEKENIHAQQVYEALGMKQMPYYMYDVRVD